MRAVRDDDGRLVDLRYVEANASALAYNQATRESLIGQTVLTLYPGQLEHGPLRQQQRISPSPRSCKQRLRPLP
jgi:hypothetical protein